MGPHLKVKEDGLLVIGEKGYRMIRATHGISEGAMYFELDFLPSTPLKISGKMTCPAVRVGWSTIDGDIQAPVGYDIHSYAWRSAGGGGKVHSAQVQNFAADMRGFEVGDTVGCWIVLPPDSSSMAAEEEREQKEKEEAAAAAATNKRRKGKKGGKGGGSHKNASSTNDDHHHGTSHDPSDPSSATSSASAALLAPLFRTPMVSDAEAVQARKFHKGSFIRFFRNGVQIESKELKEQHQHEIGIIREIKQNEESKEQQQQDQGQEEEQSYEMNPNAWTDVLRGTYFPAISLYMGATVRANFGPNFKYPPREVIQGYKVHLKKQQQLQQQRNAIGGVGVGTMSTSPIVTCQPSDATATSGAALKSPTPTSSSQSSTTVTAPSPSPSPPPSTDPLPTPPFQLPLSRTLLTSGLFPHVEGSGAMMHFNPKQVQADWLAAQEAREKAFQQMYEQAMAMKSAAAAGTGGGEHGGSNGHGHHASTSRSSTKR